MGKIEKILKKGPVEGQTTEVYPVTSTKAVYDENNKRLDNIITGLQESVYLNTPIPISTEDTPEANAQNVKNIADYVEKAKAAGIADVNGMAVTCLIDDNCSGVGYIMGNTDVSIQGILIFDDLVNNTVFTIYAGRYSERLIVTENSDDIVTSNMLVQGARKPIILTPDTTEVDEETYQKLLKDNVDVILKTDVTQGEGNLCTLTYETDNGDCLSLYFTCFSAEGGGMGDSYLYAYQVDITKTSPHTCSITEYQNGSFESLLDLRYLRKSVLNLILQEIDLTGTDEDRKTRLNKFAVDWKALTGASDLNGARFVGSVSMNDGALTNVLLSYDLDENYSGISMSDDVDESHLKKIVVHPNNGSVESIPLFSHLEAITIKTGNTPEDKDANIAAIKAYVDNLTALGVDVTKGCTIPVYIDGIGSGFLGRMGGNIIYYMGVMNMYGASSFGISVDAAGGYYSYKLQTETDNSLTTTSKKIVGAINEIDTLAKSKQDALTSGTNIKTINNQSLLGSGNIEISAPSITVDTTISDTSMNPVQNKVIKAYIDGLVGNVAAQLAQI